MYCNEEEGMKLEELQVYQLAMEIAEKVWAIVNEWDYFSKDTVGKQLVKSSRFDCGKYK
jgi:hypothetical protein